MVAERPTRAAFFLRLGIAHLLAYPIAMAWAIAWIPPFIVALPESYVMNASVDDIVHVVLRRLLWPAVFAFVIEHLVVLPWALAGTTFARRLYAWSSAALVAIAVFGGGAFWAWLVLR